MKKIVYSKLTNSEWNSLNPEILESALFTGDRTWDYPNVSSPFNRIYLMISGEAYLKDEQGTYPLLPGYMYLIPATSCYTYKCNSTIHKFFFHFSLELFPGVDVFSHFKTIQKLTYSSELLDTILTEAQNESVANRFHLKVIFWQIIYEFFLHATKDIDYMDFYKDFHHQKQVLNYLSSHLSASLRIQDIADELNMSAYHLSRSFKRDTSYGLKEYIEQMLLKKARKLLLYTDFSISQISEMLGFTDPFYFSRFFKKYEHISPREYRKQAF